MSLSCSAKRSEEQEAESGETGGDGTVTGNHKQVDEESPLLDSSALIPTSFKVEDHKEDQKEAATDDYNANKESSSAEEPLEEEITAATKIQAGFRGYKARKHLKDQSEQQKEDKPESPTQNATTDTFVALEDAGEEEIIAATKLQAGFRGYQTRKALREEKDAGSEPSNAPPSETLVEGSEKEVAAATTLQAGFRGYQTRKSLKEQKQQREQDGIADAAATTSNETADDNHASSSTPAAEEEPLQEEVLAATKIQAGFRGFQARKALREHNEQDQAQPTNGSASSPPPIALDALQEEIEAATKLQAGFRGYQTRKSLKEQRQPKQRAQEDQAQSPRPGT